MAHVVQAAQLVLWVVVVEAVDAVLVVLEVPLALRHRFLQDCLLVLSFLCHQDPLLYLYLQRDLCVLEYLFSQVIRLDRQDLQAQLDRVHRQCHLYQLHPLVLGCLAVLVVPGCHLYRLSHLAPLLLDHLLL